MFFLNEDLYFEFKKIIYFYIMFYITIANHRVSTITETKPMNAMGMQMGSTMSMGSTGSTETESSLESSCSKDSASTSSSLSTSSCEPASTISYGSAIGGGSSSVTSKTTETSTATYATPRKDVARTSPIASTDLSTAITQELQRRAQQVKLIDIQDKLTYLGFSSVR